MTYLAKSPYREELPNHKFVASRYAYMRRIRNEYGKMAYLRMIEIVFFDDIRKLDDLNYRLRKQFEIGVPKEDHLFAINQQPDLIYHRAGLPVYCYPADEE